MNKKDKFNAFRCKCGFTGNEKQLINHCLKIHSDDPFMLFDILGTAGNLKNANRIILNLLAERTSLQYQIQNLNKENQRLINEIEKGNIAIKQLTHTLNIISGAINNIPKEKFDDIIIIVNSALELLGISFKKEKQNDRN